MPSYRIPSGRFLLELVIVESMTRLLGTYVFVVWTSCIPSYYPLHTAQWTQHRKICNASSTHGWNKITISCMGIRIPGAPPRGHFPSRPFFRRTPPLGTVRDSRFTTCPFSSPRDPLLTGIVSADGLLRGCGGLPRDASPPYREGKPTLPRTGTKDPVQWQWGSFWRESCNASRVSQVPIGQL